jgi:hypothetical protein
MTRLFVCILLSVFLSVGARAQQDNPQYGVVSEFVQEYLAIKYPSLEWSTFIYVGVERQELYLFINGVVERVYQVSTSKHGAGSVHGSNCTPVGLHCIDGKFGQGVPKGGIFVGRKFTGELAEIHYEPYDTGHDDITTRVLTLRGLEEGVNKGEKIDSYKRHIYIHGTAEEGLIGKPASHGCIRMRNDDVIELFSLVNEGLPIVILDN